MTTRSRAADDFDFIGKRLRELQSSKTGSEVEGEVSAGRLESMLKRLRKLPGRRPLSAQERKEVGTLLNCTFSTIDGCGKQETKACVIAGKCVSKNV